MSCSKPNFLGESDLFKIEYAIAGPEIDPRTLTFKPFGSINSKNYTLTTNTVENTTDTSGEIASLVTTGKSFEATVTGYQTDEDTLIINQDELLDYYINNTCYTIWIRLILGSRVLYAYVLPASRNGGGSSKEVVTFEMSFTARSTNVAANLALQIDPMPGV
jgi:hypothetical protein